MSNGSHRLAIWRGEFLKSEHKESEENSMRRRRGEDVRPRPNKIKTVFMSSPHQRGGSNNNKNQNRI